MLPPPIDQGTVLIIGATEGIGRELSRLLSRRVRTLVLVDRRAERLEPLREELLARNPTLGVLLHPCDVCDPHQVDELLSFLDAHFVRVDVLVNNAAVGNRGLYAEERWGQVQETLRANVWAPALLTHRLLGPMLQRGRGGVLNISSGAAQLFLPGSAVFAATQRFLDGFTEALRLEVEGRGIAVTRVARAPVGGGHGGHGWRRGALLPHLPGAVRPRGPDGLRAGKPAGVPGLRAPVGDAADAPAATPAQAEPGQAGTAGPAAGSAAVATGPWNRARTAGAAGRRAVSSVKRASSSETTGRSRPGAP
ncbi:SDR family NAD(P)-dependent oxidoreductase [Pyxidicoccus sp. 3LG]